ncbi:MAG: hypothetical protein AAF480_12120 [Actinomycetota bacterium]
MADKPLRPEVEVLFEGDADHVVDVPILGDAWHAEETTGDPSHVVGTDRLGHVVSVVSDTVEAIREQRREEQMAAGGTSTTMFPERQAQVIQATKVPFVDVIALLAQGLTAPGLALDDTVPRADEGIAIFPGRLRMKILPLPRVVELRVYPTASSNLTVLELQPRRKWMPQTRRYLSAGVPRITELTDRIERAAASGARHPARPNPPGDA